MLFIVESLQMYPGSYWSCYIYIDVVGGAQMLSALDFANKKPKCACFSPIDNCENIGMVQN